MNKDKFGNEVSSTAVELSNENKIYQDKKSIVDKRRDLLKWDGWGYNDTFIKIFVGSNPFAVVSGDRYINSSSVLPHMADLIEKSYGLALNDHDFLPRRQIAQLKYPAPCINEGFLQGIKSLKVLHSFEGLDRLRTSHGQTLHEIYTLRVGMFERIPDLVVWPDSHDDVEKIVGLAVQHNVVIVPYGGGTNVTKSLLCEKNEERMIISLEMSQMNKILWLNPDNLTAKVEAGIIGKELERKMKEQGYTVGHEPDSYEFSSLGGWIATRASGMKKNTYGNIEDLVVQLRVVTPRGSVERFTAGPRVSSGPDINHLILGSEGIYGIVTEVTLKIRPVPVFVKYGSVIFPDFESGVAFMREVARRRCQPSSVRLMDNDQFKLGQSFRPERSWFKTITDKAKVCYLSWLRRFDLDKMCVCTLLLEGNRDEVLSQETQLYSISRKYFGIPAGESAGKQGYNLTFIIAYIRDVALGFGILAESFETSVPWDKVVSLCHNVKHKVNAECSKKGITHNSISCRVTQTYDAGACIYFYFSFNGRNLDDPVKVYEDIEDLAREEILSCGGSISHHHGVGKLRAKFLNRSIPESAIGALKALKEYFDPTNIFASNNLVPLNLPKSKL